MNITEQQARELYERLGKTPSTFRQNENDLTPRIVTPKRPAPVYVSGPLSVTLVLWGHCPSKKSNYRVTADGMISSPETKRQMETLTLQAMLQWSKQKGPVEHPDVTTRFYVETARQDEDGMYVTLMDVLQKAGVIANDNIAHFNGRKIHEPCEFVVADQERVEILIEKK